MRGAKGVIISITGGEDMRLMEVDEAASHIKELVDPDANIIWGSAFNNDLGGKIRVSVVATGIEADAVSQPTPAKVFSFPKAAPAPKPSAEQDETPLELTAEDEARDELLLDSDDILTQPVGKPPIAPPADEDTLAAPGTPAAAPSTGGGTLFERMSNIARGAPKAQLEDDGDVDNKGAPIDIPRFLNRQSNQ